MEEFGLCLVCGRTPLVGECVTVYLAGGGEQGGVCDLCLEKPRVHALGEPIRRDRVRSAAGAANVRRIFPRPVAPRPVTPQPEAAPAAPPMPVG